MYNLRWKSSPFWQWTFCPKVPTMKWVGFSTKRSNPFSPKQSPGGISHRGVAIGQVPLSSDSEYMPSHSNRSLEAIKMSSTWMEVTWSSGSIYFFIVKPPCRANRSVPHWQILGTHRIHRSHHHSALLSSTC